MIFVTFVALIALTAKLRSSSHKKTGARRGRRAVAVARGLDAHRRSDRPPPHPRSALTTAESDEILDIALIEDLMGVEVMLIAGIRDGVGVIQVWEDEDVFEFGRDGRIDRLADLISLRDCAPQRTP